MIERDSGVAADFGAGGAARLKADVHARVPVIEQLFPPQQPGGDGVEAFLAEHPDLHAVVAKQRLECGVENVQATGECPHCGQHEAAAVADEARAADRMPVPRQPRGGRPFLTSCARSDC